MNEWNVIEFLVYSIALLVYVFTNFHLTYLICNHTNDKTPVVIVAHMAVFGIGEVVLCSQLRHQRFDDPLFLFLVIVLCHYVSLFLYECKQYLWTPKIA